jgi:hypothetical protein
MVARDPEEVVAGADSELDAAESNVPAGDQAEPDFDPTGTTALETELTSLKGAAEELEETDQPGVTRTLLFFVNG